MLSVIERQALQEFYKCKVQPTSAHREDIMILYYRRVEEPSHFRLNLQEVESAHVSARDFAASQQLDTCQSWWESEAEDKVSSFHAMYKPGPRRLMSAEQLYVELQNRKQSEWDKQDKIPTQFRLKNYI